ncbi:MAG: helix-turn-helix domain-containing protein [Myxococcota bacterium]
MPVSFKARLRELRNAAHLTQDGLADGVGVSQAQLSRIEGGQVRPSLDVIDRMARVLGVSRWALVGGTELADLDPGGNLVSVHGAPGVAWLAYFASGLTGLNDADRERLFKDASVVRTVCENLRAYLYEPVHYTDPVHHPDITAAEVYATDRAQVAQSDLVVLYCGYPSFGAGQELEIATQMGLPVVALVPEGTRVSRMVLGAHVRIHQVTYTSPLDLMMQLRDVLPRVFNELANRVRLPQIPFGERLRAQRERRSLSLETVANAVGLSVRALADMESERWHLHNPSLVMLRKLAHVLETSVAHLVDGVVQTPDLQNDALLRSKIALEDFAVAEGIPFGEVRTLWDRYAADYEVQRRTFAEARTEPLTVADWRNRRTPAPTQVSLLGDD